MVLLVAALVTTACAPLSGEPGSVAPPPQTDPSLRGVEPMEQDPPHEERPTVEYDLAEEPQCLDGRNFGVAFTSFDAALGSRYHSARVKNCTAEELTIDKPVFMGLDPGNIWGEVFSEPMFDETPVGVTLGPGKSAYLGINWSSNGRCERGIQRLRLQLGDEHFDSPENCLQLGGPFAPEDNHPDIRYEWSQP